jgi:hypothetical protein
VSDGAPILPTGPNSALRTLRLRVEEWTIEGKASLARQLRTGTALEELHVVSRTGRPVSHRPWVEALELHNNMLLVLSERSVYDHPDTLRTYATRKSSRACGATKGFGMRSMTFRGTT